MLAPDLAAWKKAWRDGVRERVGEAAPGTGKLRRRLGLRWMLEDVRRGRVPVGEKVTGSARLVSAVLVVLMFLAGVGVVRGLLADFSYQELKFSRVTGDGATEAFPVALSEVTRSARGFNIWIFLAVTLGVQWCFLVFGVLGYWLWRRWHGSLTLLESGVQWLLRKAGGGKIDSGIWSRLKNGASGGKGVIGWRLTRMLQAAGIGYNLGLIAGLFACLWFLNVGYYWETSLPQFGGESLNTVTRIMSAPTGEVLPGRRAVAITRLGHSATPDDYADAIGGSIPPRQAADLLWSVFFFFSLAVYGLLPRLLMWLGAWWMERRALAGLDFQESHHRTLWREATGVQRGQVATGQTDGVVLLDIGGLETSTEDVRPFLLQTMRVNPEQRFSLGTLDQDGEKRALEAARAAAQGVVFLVEGWNLSPKQMAVYHRQVRDAIGAENMIRYLVLGNRDELEQWKVFVDGLKDSEAEVYHFQS